MDTTQIEAVLDTLASADPADAPALADEVTEELSKALEPLEEES